jgi:YggT family protein
VYVLGDFLLALAKLIVRFLYQVTEPVLRPIRQRLPATGIDFSPLVVILGIYFLQWFLVPVLVKTAYRIG